MTGSGKQRVGWHVADALARRGYAVAVHYNSSLQEARQTIIHLRSLGVQAEKFQADLSQPDTARGLVDAVLKRFLRIDVLVTCASVWSPKPLEEINAADLRHNFDVNVAGTFFCAQQAGLAMVKQVEGGSIVLFGDWSVTRPYVNYSAYFASKGAIPVLTRCLAVELGTRNPRVRVNCIEPGPAMVPAEVNEEEKCRIANATLVKQLGKPEDLASAVLSLVDNPFVTGVCLPVDGGRSIYAGGY